MTHSHLYLLWRLHGEKFFPAEIARYECVCGGGGGREVGECLNIVHLSHPVKTGTVCHS